LIPTLIAVFLDFESIHAEPFDTTNYFFTFPAVIISEINGFLVGNGADQQVKLCSDLEKVELSLKWLPDFDGCGRQVNWKSKFKSQQGRPLLYSEFGSGENVTLILGGVHPDEITPISMAFRFANHIAKNPDLVAKNTKVVVAPLINPDGFLVPKQSRTNANGVDLNRNFFTKDWYISAKSWWHEKRQRSPRHFPGQIPNSEIETLYQIWLIETFRPDKIISIHAPLGFYDYDGPGERKVGTLTESEKKAKKLVVAMSTSSKNYKIVDYSFYPGSLGNYAGNERGIPTITLELETIDANKVDQYWRQFSPGLVEAISFPFSNPETVKARGASLFLGGLSRRL
jgi:murein peptide amidase A